MKGNVQHTQAIQRQKKLPWIIFGIIIMIVVAVPAFRAYAQATVTPTATPDPRQPIVGQTAQVYVEKVLRMRVQPSTKAAKVMELKSHAVVKVLEGPTVAEDYQWYKVDYDGVQGWVAADAGDDFWTLVNSAAIIDCSKVLPPTKGQFAFVNVLDDGLSLQEKPTIYATELTKLPYGTRVVVTQTNGVSRTEDHTTYSWLEVTVTIEGKTYTGWAVESADNVCTLYRPK